MVAHPSHVSDTRLISGEPGLEVGMIATLLLVEDDARIRENVFEIFHGVVKWRGPGRVAGVPRAMRRVMVAMAAQRMMASAVAGWRS